jgi:hypothetical protein
MQRKRSKPHSFKDRLIETLNRTQIQADRLRPGPKQDALLEKVRQLEAAVDMNDYLTSPNLRAPT